MGASVGAWVQNGCIIRFRDAPMQYAYAPMSKNGCMGEKESPAANLLAVSKKAAGLSSYILFQLKSVFERFADTLCNLVITMGVWIKCDSIDQ